MSPVEPYMPLPFVSNGLFAGLAKIVQTIGEQIVSNDVAESINQLIAGRFGHIGLRQLHTKCLID